MADTGEIQSIKSQIEKAINITEAIKSSLSDLGRRPEYASLGEYFYRVESNMDHVNDNLREAGNELMWIEDVVYGM